jgi:hypothetical protein
LFLGVSGVLFMNSRTISLAALSLLIPCMTAVWLMLKPQTASASTLAVFATLVVATGGIVLNTWRNAQATTSTSHLIYATESAAPRNR